MRKAADFQNSSDLSLSRAAERGLMYLTAEDQVIGGRTLTLQGRELLQFGSGSYLGLETDARLKAGAIEAIERYGTQFPSSRAFVSAPLYAEAEALLAEIFGMPTLMTASSTLAHISAIPVLVEEGDAVLLDHQVHHTVQMAVNHVRVQGVYVEMIRHSRLDVLEEKIEALRKKYRRVWYMADGIYSMYGDRAPMAGLTALLNRYEQFRLYIDDAHGMSWTGQRGRGHVLEELQSHPQMVLATSLAKSFSSGGGALVVPDPDMRRKIRTIGSSLVFSGPLQPANLGAAIASARIHLSDEIGQLQAALAERIRYCNDLCRQFGLPLVSFDEAPIRFLALGHAGAACALSERLMDDGFFSNVAVFPVVPMQRAGLRFTITKHQTRDDIRRFVEAMARHVPEVLAAEGSSLEKVRRLFKMSSDDSEGAGNPAHLELTRTVPEASRLRLVHATTIEAVDAAEWDRLLGHEGSFTVDGLRLLEAAYCDNSKPEDNWKFHYFIVRDDQDKPILATFFTEALWKDDMLAPIEVSRRVEAQRAEDPYHLTSLSLLMGALATEGNHLYLDRSADWKQALGLMLQAAREQQAACGAANLVLRDLPAGHMELQTYLLDQGFAKFSSPDSFILELDWQDEAALLASLSRNSRRHLQQSVLPWQAAYDVEVLGVAGRQPSEAELSHFHGLYRQLKARAFDINTFDLPEDFFRHVAEAPGWELLALSLRAQHGGRPGDAPVGVVAAYVGDDHFVPLVAGLEERYRESHGLYRALLWHSVQRARQLGLRRVHLGLGAPLEKSRLGAKSCQHEVYLQTADLFRLELLGQLFLDTRGQR